MSNTMPPLRVGTRGSKLALIQARAFIAAVRPLRAAEESVIRTTGDTVQDRRLADVGGKGLFAKEIHEALVSGRIDCAVHSLKDLETPLPPGIVLACMLPREDPRDALVIGKGGPKPDQAAPFASLAPGSVIGTAAMRRQAQVLHVRPDLAITTLRGNVDTRLAKLAAGDCNATLLAQAGLVRLGMAASATLVLDPEVMVPAAGQGIIGVTVREGDKLLRALFSSIDDIETRLAATAERAVVAALDGTCRTPIGAYTRLEGHALQLTALIARPDGSFLLKRELRGLASDAERIGRELGASLRADAPGDVFA